MHSCHRAQNDTPHLFMLSRREPYRDPGVDYEALSAKKNAPRWVKALIKIGKWPTAKPAVA